MDLDLFPRPRFIEVSGPGSAGPVTSRIDASLPAEGFELHVGPAGVEIVHADVPGLRYARATLDQILSQSPDGPPGLHIRDWPDFERRAYMLDISRDRVPTRETLSRLVSLCALARINHLELYTEHTFAFSDHEVVWKDASPITALDVQWLDDLCAAAGIELVPNLNCFGHMARWLKHDAYRQRAECPDGVELLPGVVLPPAVLAPTVDNANFVLDLFHEFLPNFSSKRVNVNCDETFELGRGVSAPLAASVGRERVYVDHLKRIVDPLAADGYQVHYWADIVRRAPAFAAELPPTATPVCWTYEAPAAGRVEAALAPGAAQIMENMGVDLDSFRGFADNTRPLAEAGVSFWVAPGTSSWDSLIGRIDNAQANLLDAVTVGAAQRATGIVITDWGDNGHLQPPSVSFGPLVWGGALAWCRASNEGNDVAALLDRYVFGDASGLMGAALVDLGLQWKRTGLRSVNSSPLQTTLLPRTYTFVTGEPDVATLPNVVDRLDAAVGAIGRARPTCVDGDIVRDELTQAARLARHGAWKLLRRAGGPVPSDAELRKDLEQAIEGQAACWLRRSRPGGLDDSLAGLRRTLARYSE
jgi:hypothetical protein